MSKPKWCQCELRRVDPGRKEQARKFPFMCRIFGHKWCEMTCFFFVPEDGSEARPGGLVVMCRRCGVRAFRCDDPRHIALRKGE